MPCLHRLTIGAATCATVLLATTAAADQLCFSASIPDETTGWAHALTIPRFDPAKGILTGIRFELNGTEQGSARAENRDSAPATVTLQFSCRLTLSRPDNTVLVIAIPLTTFTDNLGAYDGTLDFGGTSGISHLNIVATKGESSLAPPPISDLALFTGPSGNPGTISLPVVAGGTSTAMGAGNLVAQFMQTASANLTVCYLYHPDCNHNGIPDAQDIANGTSQDFNHNGKPDECEPQMGTYCYGDGSGNGGPDCPCMNNAPPSTGEGCINSLGTGALLTPSGDPSVSNDTLVMTATQYPPNTHGYFFAGTAQVNGGLGIQLGDGLRCIGGQVVRIGKVPPGGSNTLPHPGDPPLSQQYMIPAGARRYYQFFYRNPAGPCSNGFSLSNGVFVIWGL